MLIAVFLLAFLVCYFAKNEKRSDTYYQSSTEPQQNRQSLHCNTETLNESKVFYRRKCLMTPSEKNYFRAIKACLSANYIIQPQVNLASVIEKQGEFRYQNELYRNIDFGIFDNEYNIRLLIEINDMTHSTPKRIERDKKVKAIASQANIPLITFYTKYGVNPEYIKKTISNALGDATFQYNNTTDSQPQGGSV